MKKPKSIAICGTRGIPANYGGFETFAQELATRLVAQDLEEVRVYCRKHYDSTRKSHFKGVKRVVLPAPRSKHLETPVHALLTIFHLLIHPVDFVIFCNGANAPFLWMLRLRGIRTALNVDGIERNRQKWGLPGKLWYRLGEFSTRYFPNIVISDADVIGDYYRSEHGLDSVVIPYGYNSSRDDEVEARLEGQELGTVGETLDKWGLKQGEFILYVSRLEPENNAHTVIEAYNQASGSLPKLVIVGWAPYAQAYIERLKAAASEEVVFTGFQFGRVYEDLQLSALCYIQATEVGGTHPALVEAMGFGQAVIANSTPENREVLGDAGLYYQKNSVSDLSEQLESIQQNPVLRSELQQKARKRAVENYSWDAVTKQYMSL